MSIFLCRGLWRFSKNSHILSFDILTQKFGGSKQWSHEVFRWLLCLWTCHHSKPLAILSNRTICYSAFYKVKFWYFVALTTSGSLWLKQSLSTVNSSVQKFNRLLIWKKVLIQICLQWSTIGNCYHWFINLEVRKTAGGRRGGGEGRKQEYDVRLNLTGKDENAISETIYFKIFQGSIPPDPLAARAFGARDCLPSKSNLATALDLIRGNEQIEKAGACTVSLNLGCLVRQD